jgi:glycosyltransferase involved in cell wall biosynthesis
MHPSARTGWQHRLASRLDRALDRPWGTAATAALGLELRAALRGVDLFHSSEQFRYAPPGAAALLTIHDLTTLVHPELHAPANVAMHTAKEQFARDRADHIIAVSQATRRDIIQHLRIPAERISVIYEAADARRFHPDYTPAHIQTVLQRYELQRGRYVLSLGTLEPRKNYVRLIEAYALLRQQASATADDLPPLLIAGGYGWLYEQILAAPERLGIAEQVRFLGNVPDADLPLLLAGAQLFVYPSLYEGFGLPVLEALACGVPVVASHSSALPEVLGTAGIYCDPLDSASIARSIGQVLASATLRTALQQAGPARAAQFSWQRAAHETLAVYEQVHAARQPA